MSNIPFEKQRLPVDLVEQIEREIALGNGVSGDILLAAIEQSVTRTFGPARLPIYPRAMIALSLPKNATTSSI